MQRMMKLAVPLITVLLAACAQLPKPGASEPAALSSSEAQVRYRQGLADYKENNHDGAIAALNAALASGQLQPAEALDARKHMGFIYCTSGREVPCREQFQAILAADPKYDLAPAEASHPAWGPVWRSVKGALEEQRAVRQAGSTSASPAQQKLAEGIKEYDDGRYKEAIVTLQAALKGGLPDKSDEIRAHKYAAFAYCLTQRTTLCRGEFRKIFALDAAFELLPSEAGHPAWARSYRNEKAAAKKLASKKK